jgi:hypothetical protein
MPVVFSRLGIVCDEQLASVGPAEGKMLGGVLLVPFRVRMELDMVDFVRRNIEVLDCTIRSLKNKYVAATFR